MRLELDIVPVPKARPRASMFGGRPRIYTPQDTARYEATLRQAAAVVMAGREPLQGPIRVSVSVALPIPAYKFQKQRRADAEAGVSLPSQRGTGDVDNYAKAVLDALNGVAFVDDCQIVTLMCGKTWGLRPGVTVSVERIDE